MMISRDENVGHFRATEEWFLNTHTPTETRHTIGDNESLMIL